MTTDESNKAKQTNIPSRQHRAIRAVNLGLFTNFILAVVKLFVGIVGHSQALLADGVNSTSDVAYYIVIRIFVMLSGKPADNEHPYGHHQFESIAALVVGAFVVTTGIAIFWDSANAAFDLITGSVEKQPLRIITLWVALATIAIKIWLMLYTTSIGRAIKNPAVAALAHDHRNDIFSSLGAAIGIILGLVGFRWVDPVAGALVAIVVTKTGIDILRESSSELMDTLPGDLLAGEIRKNLAAIPGIEEIEDIGAHRFGPYLVMNITICVNGSISVAEGDRIASAAEQRLIDEIEMVRKVYVHYHPTTQQQQTINSPV